MEGLLFPEYTLSSRPLWPLSLTWDLTWSPVSTGLAIFRGRASALHPAPSLPPHAELSQHPHKEAPMPCALQLTSHGRNLPLPSSWLSVPAPGSHTGLMGFHGLESDRSTSRPLIHSIMKALGEDSVWAFGHWAEPGVVRRVKPGVVGVCVCVCVCARACTLSGKDWRSPSPSSWGSEAPCSALRLPHLGHRQACAWGRFSWCLRERSHGAPGQTRRGRVTV